MMTAPSGTRSGAASRPLSTCVAPAQVVEDGLAARRWRVQAALAARRRGALLERDVEPQPQVRVRQHDRADVAARHHDAAAAASSRWTGSSAGPDAGSAATAETQPVDRRLRAARR